eukprot:1441234-Amphidinium_carterae.2
MQGGCEDLYLLMAALRPQKQLMKNLMDLSNQALHIKDMHRSWSEHQPRKYGMFHFYSAHESGHMANSFQKSMNHLVHDELVWSVCARDEARVTHMYRLCLRASAVVHELIQLRCRGYPAKLFRVLQHQEDAATHVLEDFVQHQCMLDSFSLHHVQSFPSVPELVSQDSFQILSAMAEQFVGSIFSTESLHSRNSIRARHRLTHELGLHHLAMWHQVVADPRWMLQDVFQ